MIFIGEKRPRLFFAVSVRAASSAARLGVRVGQRLVASRVRRTRRLGARPVPAHGRPGARVGAVAEAIDQAQRQRFLGAGMAAAQHQIERGLHADQTRRALRAAEPGQQAQLHFGQAELGAIGAASR